MIPTRSTRPINALRPGFAKKAWMICRYSTIATSAHRTRNTSMRTRKIRGEDNLFSSISIAEREEGPEGILTSVAGNLIHTMAQRQEKSAFAAGCTASGGRERQIGGTRPETRGVLSAYSIQASATLGGPRFRMNVTYVEALV